MGEVQIGNAAQTGFFFVHDPILDAPGAHAIRHVARPKRKRACFLFIEDVPFCSKHVSHDILYHVCGAFVFVECLPQCRTGKTCFFCVSVRSLHCMMIFPKTTTELYPVRAAGEKDASLMPARPCFACL